MTTNFLARDFGDNKPFASGTHVSNPFYNGGAPRFSFAPTPATSSGFSGVSSSSPFGSVSTPAFGSTSSPAFGFRGPFNFGPNFYQAPSVLGPNTNTNGFQWFGSQTHAGGNGHSASSPGQYLVIGPFIPLPSFATYAPSYTPFLPNGDGIIPKLQREGYYTKPGLQELAAIERSEPGFCCRVKDFTVVRHGYGSIMFEGEIDVRGLDLDHLVTFNDREVTIDCSLQLISRVLKGGRSVVVTLLNVDKCYCEDSGAQHVYGTSKDSQQMEKLMKAVKRQGGEFLYYDPVSTECKFRVWIYPYEFRQYKLKSLGDQPMGCLC